MSLRVVVKRAVNDGEDDEPWERRVAALVVPEATVLEQRRGEGEGGEWQIAGQRETQGEYNFGG